MPENVQPEQVQPERHTPTNGNVLLRKKDPQGFEITLNLDTWEAHITLGHPEMHDKLDLVAKTIEEPEVIYQSAQQRTSYCYYRLTGRSMYKRNDLYMLVIVHRDDSTKTGFVKTAHLTPKLRPSENLVWFTKYRT